jgi:hypothetical protein
MEEESAKGFGGKARRDHLEDQGVDVRIGSEWILGRLPGGVYSGSSWLRIEAGGELL